MGCEGREDEGFEGVLEGCLKGGVKGLRRSEDFRISVSTSKHLGSVTVCEFCQPLSV